MSKQGQQMTGNDSLTPKQLQFMQWLLKGEKIVDAAEKTSIAEKTAHRWLNTALFQREYKDARDRLLNHSLTGLQLSFDSAVATLKSHLTAANTIPRDQIKAAEVIVEKSIETARLVERITELETLLAEQEQARMYTVIFDLRHLTKDERETLERIDDRVTARKQRQIA